MNHIFLATTGRGVARAEQAADGTWAVESDLADRNVPCLAADPLNRRTVFAGTRGGSRGYILKGTDQAEMLRAIRAVADGEAGLGNSKA